MKLRLTQPQYENFTAQMGTVTFENGLSVADVKAIDAVRIAAQFLCEWEDGTPASVAQSIIDHANSTTDTITFSINADQAIATQAAEATAATKALSDENDKRKVKSTYTKEQLEEVADKQGIKGLRAIADPLGIKSNSINEMIEALTAEAKA